MITVYAIQDVGTGRRYVGITNNLSRRLREHRKKQSTGSRHLGEFRLVYTEEHPDYASARPREKYLKSGSGHRWLSAYIASHGQCPGPARQSPAEQDEVRACPAAQGP